MSLRKAIVILILVFVIPSAVQLVAWVWQHYDAIPEPVQDGISVLTATMLAFVLWPWQEPKR